MAGPLPARTSSPKCRSFARIFPASSAPPVTLEVIRETDDEPLSARVDDITLVPEPCDTPFDCQRR